MVTQADWDELEQDDVVYLCEDGAIVRNGGWETNWRKRYGPKAVKAILACVGDNIVGGDRINWVGVRKDYESWPKPE